MNYPIQWWWSNHRTSGFSCPANWTGYILNWQICNFLVNESSKDQTKFHLLCIQQDSHQDGKHNWMEEKRREEGITRKQCSHRTQHLKTWREEKQKRRWSGLISKTNWHWFQQSQLLHLSPSLHGTNLHLCSFRTIASWFVYCSVPHLQAHLSPSIFNHAHHPTKHVI